MSDIPETYLILTGIGIPPYSARGLTQTLDPIPASQHLERASDGSLIDFSIPEMRKYMSKISCTDQALPALAGIWTGSTVVVDCIQELPFPTASPGLKERTEVPGSIRVDGDFTYYRPRLTMKVTHFSGNKVEYEARVSWTLDLEEA